MIHLANVKFFKVVAKIIIQITVSLITITVFGILRMWLQIVVVVLKHSNSIEWRKL